MSTENRLFEAVPVEKELPPVGEMITYLYKDRNGDGFRDSIYHISKKDDTVEYLSNAGITHWLRPLSTPSQEKWISVKDRLPESKPLESKVVLTINKGGHVDVLTFWQNSWYKDKVLDETEISHWMPLPSPPTA